MPQHGQIATEKEVRSAGFEGLKGAIHGAATWGAVFLAAGAVAQTFYPLYRGLTFQFKVYIQMSGMTIGSIIDADRRLRAFESQERLRKLRRDQEVWRRYEEEYQRSAAASVKDGTDETKKK